MPLKPEYFFNSNGFKLIEKARAAGIRPYTASKETRHPNRPHLTVIEVEPWVIKAWDDDNIVFKFEVELPVTVKRGMYVEMPRLVGRVDNGRMAHYPASDPNRDGWEYDDGTPVEGVEILLATLTEPL